MGYKMYNTHAYAQFDGKPHKRPSGSDASAVTLTQEKVECHQVLVRHKRSDLARAGSNSAYQGLHRGESGFFEDGALEERRPSQMMILLGLDVVCRASNIHQAADGENHEHERQLMRHERIVHLWGRVWVVELAERGLVELRHRDGVVPDRPGEIGRVRWQ